MPFLDVTFLCALILARILYVSFLVCVFLACLFFDAHYSYVICIRGALFLMGPYFGVPYLRRLSQCALFSASLIAIKDLGVLPSSHPINGIHVEAVDLKVG